MDGRLLAAGSQVAVGRGGGGWQQVLDKTELKVDRQPFCLLIFWIYVFVGGFFCCCFLFFCLHLGNHSVGFSSCSVSFGLKTKIKGRPSNHDIQLPA